MKDIIEKQLKQEFDSLLSELDIDGEVERMIGKGKLRELLKREIDKRIAEKVADEIQLKIYRAVQKQMPIIDAYTDNQVRSLLIKILDVEI